MRFSLFLVCSSLLLAPGCKTTASPPEEDAGVADGGTDSGPQATHIMINFSVDDRANQTYDAEQGLAWKGSFALDAATNVLTYDAAFLGPFPMLYDDGPISSGGHEPAGSTAADHIWGVSVRFAIPSTAVSFEYGAISGSVAGSDGSWIWIGPNGTFEVPAGATDDVTAVGLVIPAT